MLRPATISLCETRDRSEVTWIIRVSRFCNQGDCTHVPCFKENPCVKKLLNSLHNVISNNFPCRFIKTAIVTIEDSGFSFRNTPHRILDLIVGEVEVEEIGIVSIQRRAFNYNVHINSLSVAELATQDAFEVLNECMLNLALINSFVAVYMEISDSVCISSLFDASVEQFCIIISILKPV